MSLPELFHHQERFVGCLTLRRIPSPRERGEAADPFWSRLFHPMGTSGYRLLLATHAYDDGTERCPALGPDGGCGIQHAGKPALCSAVPLDPLAPIDRQARVLARRATQAEFFGSNCVVSGKATALRTPRALPLIADGRVTTAARESLETSWRQLELDRRFWGDAVYRLLPGELLESSLVPVDGFLSISIVPVLMIVARLSEGCRQRCLRYLSAQARAIDTALGRLPVHATQPHRQLSGFAENAATLRQALLDSAHEASPANADRDTRAIEQWLDTGVFHDAAPGEVAAVNAR